MKRHIHHAAAIIGASLIVLSGAAVAQTSYDDVAVIVNSASDTSITIGRYFASARSLPDANVILVNVPPTEEIDSTTFELLRGQVESFLDANGLTDKINYLVTTKGVPLKVNRGSTFSTSSPSSSVESELALILGPHSDKIGKPGHLNSPYYSQSSHFSRAQYGIYLVTRLDGYSLTDIFGLIDRSGPSTPVDSSALFVFDQDPSSQIVYLNNYLKTAAGVLVSKGKRVLLNEDTTFVTGQTGVIGYVSWGSNDGHADAFAQHAMPHNVWAPGAIAETYVSTSGRSFDSPPSYGQSLIADLIAEGVSGAKGYVFEPYSSSMANASILMDRYTSGYNLAESYFMASSSLSWMDVVIGDPKTSITEPVRTVPTALQYLQAVPDTDRVVVTILWATTSEYKDSGFVVQRWDPSTMEFVGLTDSLIPGHGTTNVPQLYSSIDPGPLTGMNSYRLRQLDLNGEERFSDTVAVAIEHPMGVRANAQPTRFKLLQNYPNPFNNSTVVRYELPDRAHATLEIYTRIGQHVARLVDEVQSAGTHEVRLDAKGLASGVYVYRLSARSVDGKVTAESVSSRKFVLLK